MQSQYLKLQRLDIDYTFVDSPIFYERAGSVIQQYLPDYTGWVRAERGFAMRHDENKFAVLLTTTDIWAFAESLSSEKLTRFSGSILTFTEDVLKTLGLSALTGATWRYRFVVQVAPLQPFIKAVINTFFQIPEPLDKTLKGDMSDFYHGIEFPCDEDLQCNLEIYQYSNKEEFRSAFPFSWEECGDRAIVIAPAFTSLPGVETLSFQQMRGFSRTIEYARAIASAVIESVMTEGGM